MDREPRGFILQPTYRIEAGQPVVHLFGKLEDGQSFLVRQSGYKPHFWVRESDHKRAADFGARPLGETGKVTMVSEPVLEVDVPTPPDTPERPLNMAEKVNYAIGPLKTGRNPYNAMRFLAYLATMEAQAIYESYGFVRAKPEELTLKPIPSR